MKKTAIVKAKDLPSGHYKRAGVIPYRLSGDGSIRFGFGVDRDSGDVSNFAGSVKPLETPIDAAIREFEEESLGVFGILSRSKTDSQYVLYSSKEIIIFFRCQWDEENIEGQFKQKTGKHSEMERLIFYDSDELLSQITKTDDPIFYEPVADLLTTAFLEHKDLIEKLSA